MEDERKVMEALTEEATQEELFPQGEQQKELTKPISEEEFKKQIHEAAIANYNKVIEDFYMKKRLYEQFTHKNGKVA